MMIVNEWRAAYYEKEGNEYDGSKGHALMDYEISEKNVRMDVPMETFEHSTADGAITYKLVHKRLVRKDTGKDMTPDGNGHLNMMKW